MSVWVTIGAALHKIMTKVASITPPYNGNLYPPFQAKVDLLLERAKEAGLNLGVFEGYRSWDRQNQLYAQGRTKPGKIVTNARAGFSAHNFGTAVDIVFRENGKWSWAEHHQWHRLGQIAESLGLIWGGSWESTLKDRPHVQYPLTFSLATARQHYREGGLDKVWSMIT